MFFAGYYYFIKIVFFFSLVRAQIKSDLMREHYLFLSFLYTLAVCLLELCVPGEPHRAKRSCPGVCWKPS